MLAVVLVLSACGSDDGESEEEPPASTRQSEAADAAGQTAATSATSIANVESTLLNCETNIGDGVPTFYSTFFRCVDVELDGDTVVISSSNLPPHLSYYYGEDSDLYEPFDVDRGEEYRPNPNQIAETSFTIRVPTAPTPIGITIDESTVNLSVGDSTDYPFGAVGVAMDGVALFNPLARPGDDIEDEKFTFDSNEGHPQEQGAYHYHAPALGPLRVLQSLGYTSTDVPGSAEVELYGVMCDGTVVMGELELDGSAADSELDLQAGHVHDIVDADGSVMLEERYHVHMAPTIGAVPRGLTPEAQYYTACTVN